MQETLRSVIPSCNLHAALHCRLSMLCTFLVLSDSCALLMLTSWLSSSTTLLSHVVCHVQSIGDQLQGHAAS